MSTFWIIAISIVCALTIAEILFPLHSIGLPIIRERIKRRKESNNERR